jgi:hypothetical protein
MTRKRRTTVLSLVAGRPGRRRVRRPGMAGAVACMCAVAVVLAGFGGGRSGGQPGARLMTVVTVGSGAGVGPWRAQDSGTGQRLYGVACLSALRCVAVGAAGTIVATADGGRIWRAQADPLAGSAVPLYAIACEAPASCYVIARPDIILVTHDGGASWSRHVLPVGASGTSLTDQACLPAYTTIAGRAALCRLGLLDISCVSAVVCYAVASTPLAYDENPLPAGPHPAPSSVWLTSDGGAHWTQQPIPPGATCNGDCTSALYGYPLEWVSCLSSGLCRAGGGNAEGCGFCGFTYAVLATPGPGQPWTCVLATAACAWVSPDAAACPTSTSCYGPETTDPFATSPVVFGSADGGADWTGIGPDWTSSVPNAIVCPAALTCYLAGTRGTIARISGGTTVTRQPTPTRSNLYGIGCAGPAACYAVGDNGTILALG